jgi:hypothetical protein
MEYSFLAKATGSTSDLSFTLGNDVGEFLLDDVSAQFVPEPSAWLLLLTGGALCALVARRSSLSVRKPSI